MDRNLFLAFFSKHVMKDAEKPTWLHPDIFFILKEKIELVPVWKVKTMW